MRQPLLELYRHFLLWNAPLGLVESISRSSVASHTHTPNTPPLMTSLTHSDPNPPPQTKWGDTHPETGLI